LEALAVGNIAYTAIRQERAPRVLRAPPPKAERSGKRTDAGCCLMRTRLTAGERLARYARQPTEGARVLRRGICLGRMPNLSGKEDSRVCPVRRGVALLRFS